MGKAINTTTANSKLPSHELVCKITDPNGDTIQLKASLFSQNNDGHEFISSLSSKELKSLFNQFAEFSVIEYGSETKAKRKFSFGNLA